MIRRLEYQQVIPASRKAVWKFFSTPLNLDDLTPPSMQFKIISGGERSIYQGQLIEYRIQLLPLVKTRWLTEITHLKEMDYFIDEQRIGPYKFWHHQHHFADHPSGTLMEDVVTYQLPFGPLGDLVHVLWIKDRLKWIFDYRASQVKQIFST